MGVDIGWLWYHPVDSGFLLKALTSMVVEYVPPAQSSHVISIEIMVLLLLLLIILILQLMLTCISGKGIP